MNTYNTLRSGTLLQGKSYTYTIQKVLGQGTFGITYLATTQVKVHGALGELETTMQVAVKEFFMRDINGRDENTVTTGSKEGIYANYKKKFAREAENLSKLKHPHIVKVLEYFEANNTVYYAMEYVEGGSLDSYIIEKKGLSEEESIKYIRQIGEALAYMHAHKMLHLDLKPGNVMLRLNKDAVLIDFGLSKQYDENGEPESSTSVGSGTPGYAPLEQANYHEGKGFPVTMDVYALGATLFKMLTGMRPPEAPEILNEGFPAYELQKHGISNAVIASIAKAMAVLKKERLQNVEAFLKLLNKDEETKKDEDTILENSIIRKRIRLYDSINDITISYCEASFPGYRSFKAKFTRNSIEVDSYIEGEFVKKQECHYSITQFEILISKINSLMLYKVSPAVKSQGFCGGENIYLEIENKLDVYHYGTKWNHFGTLDGDVYPLLEMIQKEIPDYDGLWTSGTPQEDDISNVLQKYKKPLLGVLAACLLIGWLITCLNDNDRKTGSFTPISRDTYALDTIMVEDTCFTDSAMVYAIDSQKTEAAEDEILRPGYYKVDNHIAVDLGLSVDWATCNVGAENPWESGDYFAWGEVEPKKSYWSKTYKYCAGTTESCFKIGKLVPRPWDKDLMVYDISESEYDAAYTQWGKGWRMPAIWETRELEMKCTWVWTENNGMKGAMVTGPNGNSIFLPAAGVMKGSKKEFSEGASYIQGSYWTSTCFPNEYGYATYLGVSSSSREYDTQFFQNYRFHGYMIRPVVISSKE